MLKGEVWVRVCRSESEAVACDPTGGEQKAAPGSVGRYTDALPAALASGTARPISYFLELRNNKGRSAGLSNAAIVLAGSAPQKIEGLQAQVQKHGVVLRWEENGESTAVRLERKLLTRTEKSDRGPLSPAPEPESQNLLVDAGTQPRAIDKTVRFGESYEYRVQRLVRVDVNGETFELNGAFSSPLRVDVQDLLPPAIPAGLVAVATQGQNGGGSAIDLSWQADPDPDVAGYIVYRREEGGSWQRISEGAPVIGPAFHDATVEAGHKYRYAVSAIDKSGHESPRSSEARESVPQN